jgi:pimeloyl-ACP methyl ester carboxylesterase
MNVRKYGKPPFNIVVVHGGPGAPGEMKSVAEELSKSIGVLEPLQSKDSVNGQVEELRNQIEKYADTPVTLIGYSWGSWLVYLLAARYPSVVKKLILVSSGPFEEQFAKEIMPTRMSRLNDKEKKGVEEIIKLLQSGQNDNILVQKFGELMSKADTFNLEETPGQDGKSQPEIYQRVWNEAEELRYSGRLLAEGKNIHCPVVAIHGDYDPHPAEGVKNPLSQVIKNFRFILLKNCGHTPWKEKLAKGEFYKILRVELT